MPRKRAIRLLGAALALFGCHRTRALEPPPVGEEVSALLLGVAGDEPRFAVAFDREYLEQGRWPAFTLREPVELYYLTYHCELSALGLERGEVVFADSPAAQVLLPPPRAVRLAKVEPGGGSPWAEVDRAAIPPGLLERLPVPKDSLCELLKSRLVPEEQTVVPDLAADSRLLARFLLPLGDGSSLAALEVSRGAARRTALYLVRPGASPEELAVPEGVLLRAASLATDGSIDFAAADGLYRAPGPRGPFTQTGVYDPVVLPVNHAALSRWPGAEDTLFLLSNDESLSSTAAAERINYNLSVVRAGQVTRIHQAQRMRGFGARTGLLATGPEEVLFLGAPDEQTFQRWSSGVLERETFPETPWRLYLIPGTGVVALTREGALFAREAPGRWREIVAEARVRRPLVLTAHLGGWVMLGFTGDAFIPTLRQVIPMTADCITPNASLNFPEVAASVSEDRLLLGSVDGVTRASFYLRFLRLDSSARTCTGL